MRMLLRPPAAIVGAKKTVSAIGPGTCADIGDGSWHLPPTAVLPILTQGRNLVYWVGVYHPTLVEG